MNKKKMLALALAVIMVASLSFGTLAWFNDSDSVTNKFMVAGSADTPDEIFSVDVWEEGPDKDGDGEPDPDEKDQDGLTYENILPGGTYAKVAHVENTGAYDQYIRVKVTVTNADAWIAALGNGYDLGTMFGSHDESKWTRYEPGVYNGQENTYTMTFYLNEKLAPAADQILFESVTIPSHLTQEDMVFIGGGFELSIVAEAVQTENLGEGVDTAQEAFAVVEQTHTFA